MGVGEISGSLLCLKGTDKALEPVSLTLVATRVGDIGSEQHARPTLCSLQPLLKKRCGLRGTHPVDMP